MKVQLKEPKTYEAIQFTGSRSNVWEVKRFINDHVGTSPKTDNGVLSFWWGGEMDGQIITVRVGEYITTYPYSLVHTEESLRNTFNIIDDKLKPCPCCGQEAVFFTFNEERGGKFGMFFDVQCTRCELGTTVGHKKTAIKVWNTRVQPEVNVPEIEWEETKEIEDGEEIIVFKNSTSQDVFDMKIKKYSYDDEYYLEVLLFGVLRVNFPSFEEADADANRIVLQKVTEIVNNYTGVK